MEPSLQSRPGMKNDAIVSSQDAFRHFYPLRECEVEEVWVMSLHCNKTIIKTEMISRGTVDQCLVHPRDVFRSACRLNASGVIVAHNHPSQDCQPSGEDVLLTHRLLRAASIMGVELIDHLIVTHQSYFSFSDQHWLGLLARSGARSRTEVS